MMKSKVVNIIKNRKWVFTIKDFIILILGGVIFFLITGGNDSEYKSEITKLESKNYNLVKKNDSLTILKDNVNIKLSKIKLEVSKLNELITDNEVKLNRLKDEKNAISDYVNSLDDDNFVNEFSKYLNRR